MSSHQADLEKGRWPEMVSVFFLHSSLRASVPACLYLAPHIKGSFTESLGDLILTVPELGSHKSFLSRGCFLATKLQPLCSHPPWPGEVESQNYTGVTIQCSHESSATEQGGKARHLQAHLATSPSQGEPE